MVFMFKVHANLLPTNLLSFFKKVNDSHNYNTRINNNKFKIRFTRTTQKARTTGYSCMCKRAKLWNILDIDVKLCKTTVQFKKKNKAVVLLEANMSCVHVAKCVIELHFCVVSL